MKTYLLLRNNRQSGPFTLAELLNEGLRSHDLVWVEGQSASWRYPAELEELKTHVPPPVLEAVLDLGFVEVQNRVVPQRTALEPLPAGILESSDIDDNAAADPLPTPRILADLPSLPAASMLNDQSVPAFDALAGLLPDDDLMPTMAWQSVKGADSGEMPQDMPDQRAGLASDGTPARVPARERLSKVNVLLPAALPDKTLVVIRRRDQEGQPVSAPRVRSRRPVLEFIAEEADIAPEVRHATVTVEQQEAETPDAAQPGTIVDASPRMTETAALEPALREHNQMEVAEAVTDVCPDQTERTVYQSGITEELVPENIPEMYGDAEHARDAAAPTLQVNISLVQKIAVITAIVSLIAVAILLANSIFNPNAYQYGTKPASSVSKQADPAGANKAIRP